MTEDEINAVLSKLQFSEPEPEAPRPRLSEASLSRPRIDESFPVAISPSRGNIAPMASSMMTAVPSASGRASIPAFGGELSVQGGYLPVRGGQPITHHGFSYERRFAHGGDVDAALHAVRQHFDEGGFLDSLRSLFSGPDYLSTGEVASPTNWGDPELASDFFKADKARMALEKRPAVGAPGDDVTGSTPQPLRRPAPEAAPQQHIAAPAPAPAPSPLFIPYQEPMRAMEMPELPKPPAPTPLSNFQTIPGALTPLSSDFVRVEPPPPQAAINNAVALAQNVVAPQDEIPTFEQALANVEKLHGAGVYSGADLDKAGEMLAAHNRAKFDNIPVGEALRLIRAEGPPIVSQEAPKEERPAARPMAYAATPAPAPAVNAIDQATGKLTARIPDEPHGTALTKQQADYIIRTIAAETSGKTPEETQAIASVILNRINSGKFGSSPEAVLFAKNQFEPWMSRASANYPLKISPTSQRYLDAREALEAALAGEDITRGATNFWAPKAQYSLGRDTPDWALRMPDYTDIGATRFHRPNREAGGEIHGDGNMSHDDIVSRALHAARRHFDGSDGSYVDPMGNVAIPAGGSEPDRASIALDNAERMRAAEDAANLARQIQAYNTSMARIQEQPEWARMMTHAPEKPRAPIQVEGGFIGKQNLGSAPFDVAGPLSSFAQGAYDLKTAPLYAAGMAFPPAAALGTALDTAEGVASGSPTQVAMGAFGGPLKVARNVIAPLTVATGVSAPDEAEAARLPKIGKISRSTNLPNIRELPVNEAIKIARKEQHLIPAGEQSESGFVGGPRDIENKRQLNKLRKDFDAYIGADPRGGDWYDRYRAAVNEVTGGDPVANKWMSSQEGQWSAGVSPQSELAFALKENNASIAGMPVKAARPAQFEAHNRAIAMRDPSEMQLGEKTGEYARLINPNQARPPGATGVNDFRHARNFNYTEAGGEAQRNALTDAQHRFLDYETALAVDRANKGNLGGRSNWTGEQLQAAPWVRQKALDILDQRPAIFERHLTEQLALAKAAGLEGDAAMASATSQAKKLAYEEAFQDANSTIGDYFDKHTAFATHEAQPGSVTQHLPGSVQATQEQRNAFAADPRSSWAFAPGGRDAIYSGLGIPDTGVSMRVRPTNAMQGMYETPAGVLETNPGEVARPLVAFNSGKAKSVAPADRALLNAGEATRAYIDAQNAGAWHKPWAGGADNLSTSYFLPMDRPATVDELTKLRGALSPHGLGDVLDTGQGITATSFYPGAPQLSRKARAEVERAIELASPQGSAGAQRVKIEPGIDTGYQSYEDAFAKLGSGDATRKLLEEVSQTPEIRAAFNRNADIPKKALANLERDNEWTKHWGVTRDDIQRSRRIIGEGPGWVDRLEKALKSGVVLPAIGAALLAPMAAQQDNGG